MLNEKIELYSETRNITGRWVRVMPESNIVEVKKHTGEYRRWLIDYTCLTMNIVPERFLMQTSQIGIQKQTDFLCSKVLVSGIDGISKGIAVELSKRGIGSIVAIDSNDIISDDLKKDIKQSYEGTNFVFNKAQLVEQNVSDFITQDTRLVIDASEDIQRKYVIQSFCRKASIPFLCIVMAGNIAAMVSVFPDTKDITGLLKGFSEKNEEILLPGINDVIRGYAMQEAMKILLGASIHMQSQAICFDFKQARVYQISF